MAPLSTSWTSVGLPRLCGLHTCQFPHLCPPGPGSENSCLPSGRPGHPGEVALPGRCWACVWVTAQREMREWGGLQLGAVGAERRGEVQRAEGEGPGLSAGAGLPSAFSSAGAQLRRKFRVNEQQDVGQTRRERPGIRTGGWGMVAPSPRWGVQRGL